MIVGYPRSDMVLELKGQRLRLVPVKVKVRVRVQQYGVDSNYRVSPVAVAVLGWQNFL